MSKTATRTRGLAEVGNYIRPPALTARLEQAEKQIKLLASWLGVVCRHAEILLVSQPSALPEARANLTEVLNEVKNGCERMF